MGTSSRETNKPLRWSKLKVVSVVLTAIICISLIGVTVSMAIQGGKKNKNEPKEDKTTGEILEELREQMNSLDKPIHAYLIPPNDAHQSEYIGDSDRRLRYVTSFTGSGGSAIVATNAAAIWVDSRYHIQADRDVDPDFWTIMKMGNPGVPERGAWLVDILPEKSRVGFDPYLTSLSEYNSLKATLDAAGHELVSVEDNLVDKVWDNKPDPNITPLEPHIIEYSGRKISDKLTDLDQELIKHSADAIVLTSLDDIACKYLRH